MAPINQDMLRGIKSFPQLVAYLRDHLDWPIDQDDFDELTFEYEPDELGLDSATATRIDYIKQLRPLATHQPWGIFFVKFAPKRLPVVALRRILRALVLTKRQQSKGAQRAAWNAHDLLFVSAYGEEGDRHMTFAHFSDAEGEDLPVLRVLGWDEQDAPLHLADAHKILTSKLAWPGDPDAADAWRTQWASAFSLRHREVVTTSRALAERLAGLARIIRKRANLVLAVETERGPLTSLMKAFKAALIHDLEPDDFADMYAQTIAYGLLSARISRPTGVTADTLPEMVPITNPFLKEMLETFLRAGGRKRKGKAVAIDFDELGVNDVVELLNNTNMEAVLRDFDNRNPQEDPVIHFYELFLKQYDAKKRMQRGVFYTPKPVVSYIVRSVHELLQTEFGLQDGLADVTTWAEMCARNPEIKLPKIQLEGISSKGGYVEREIDPITPFVQILDPATGTATFLVEVIEIIFQTMRTKWRKAGKLDLELPGLWNEYVPRHLLPRLHGYELMMAPYAIAHMKIGLKLFETGYTFGSDERARIYLTNALEPPQDFSDTFKQMAPALAHEAKAVNDVKRHQRFTVLIGNPPYSGTSANTGKWVSDLVRDYYRVDGADLGERNPKWLQDDYVKFIRASQFVCNLTPFALFGFITNHGYIDNPTFRGMRQSLLTTFQRLWVLDLHGNVKKKETTPEGGPDENVFDIQQGVAILLASRHVLHKTTQLKQADLFGARADKYDLLAKRSEKSFSWRQVKPVSPFYVFLPQDEDVREEYLRYPSIKDIMPVNVLGFQTHRDHFAIAIERDEIVSRCEALRNTKVTDAEIQETFELKDNRDWNVQDARDVIRSDTKWKNHIVRCLYRPFDVRWCYFSTVAMDYPRRELLDHVAGKENLCLLIPRQISFLPWRHSGVSDMVAESCLVSTKTKEQNYNFPLYLYLDRGGLALADGKRPNFSETFLRSFATLLKAEPQKPHGLPAGLAPEDILKYVYAVFHSPGYRSRYAEFLKTDFPRLPMSGNLELLHLLARLGGELTALHLLESPALSKPVAKYQGAANPEVEKISYADGTVWLDKMQRCGFAGVSEVVWNFHIGGYQVCEKWLKDRKGRRLSKDDIVHYQKIIVALSETIRLMKEIDETIEKHGGWPGAFITEKMK